MRVPTQVGVLTQPVSVDFECLLTSYRYQAPQIENNSRANQRAANHDKSDKRKRMDTE